MVIQYKEAYIQAIEETFGRFELCIGVATEFCRINFIEIYTKVWGLDTRVLQTEVKHICEILTITTYHKCCMLLLIHNSYDKQNWNLQTNTEPTNK